jgi:hypothetical protein
LADEWRRYLRQQIELGGAEIVLSEAGCADTASHPEPFDSAQGRPRQESGGDTSYRDPDTTVTGAIPRSARDDARGHDADH